MFEYFGICIPVLRHLIAIIVAGISALALHRLWLFWLSWPPGERNLRPVKEAFGILFAGLVAFAVFVAIRFASGDPSSSCPEIRETVSHGLMPILRG